jgi:hypothetical protein
VDGGTPVIKQAGEAVTGALHIQSGNLNAIDTAKISGQMAAGETAYASNQDFQNKSPLLFTTPNAPYGKYEKRL